MKLTATTSFLLLIASATTVLAQRDFSGVEIKESGRIGAAVSSIRAVGSSSFTAAIRRINRLLSRLVNRRLSV
jgi:hypothetical protein